MNIGELVSGHSGALFSEAENDRLLETELLQEQPFIAESAVELRTPTLLWGAERMMFGDILPPIVQSHKDCVSVAWAQACHDWLIQRSAGPVKRVSSEILYGGARCQIGKNKLQVPGCYASWAAMFVTLYGGMLRQNVESFDLTNYNKDLVLRFENQGIPMSLLQNNVKQLSELTNPPASLDLHVGKIKDGESAWSAIGQRNPLPFSCKRGFQLVRGPEGICQPLGEWNHSMVIRGRCITKSGTYCFAVQNSVGDYLGETNRTVELQDGSSIKLPSTVFLITMEVFSEICEHEDVFVVF